MMRDRNKANERNDDLLKQLAAAQADNARLRDLRYELAGIAADFDAGIGFDIMCRYTLQRVMEALAQPLDTSALDAYVAKSTWKWVSVEDRLPECDMTPNSFGVQILVYPPMQETGCTPMNVAFYGCRQTDEPNFYIFGRVFEPTHWMPLPPAPEKE